MCYTITLLSLLFGTFLFTPSTPDVPGGVEGYGRGWGSGLMLPDASSLCTLAAAQAQTTAPDRQQSAPEKKGTESLQDQQDEKPSQRTDKKPPLKDFQPSEKIDADKAVDFPADI